MKKALPLLLITLFFGNIAILKAQCYGNVNFDQAVAAVPTSSTTNSFTINTTHCNELIMIAYDGWNRSSIGTGPVTVDGNAATWINTANSLLNPPSSGAAETYAYVAPAVGLHTIVCTETGYNSSYDLNFAADFYATGSVYPLTIASLTSTQTTVSCAINGPITGNITTTIANSMIYDNVEYNTGSNSSNTVSWTLGTTFLNDTHVGNGIIAGDAYTSATTAGGYAITATLPGVSSAACGGVALVLVAIPPPLCGTPLTAADIVVQPTCGANNGKITVNASGGDAPYTYTWSPNVSTTNIATGLSAGTYSITVSDANCNVCNPAVLIVNLTGPVLTLTANTTANELCFGNCNGSATCTFTSASTPYTYHWTPVGGTNATATGLCAGTYTITATDNNGCFKTAAITITQPTLLTATTAGTNVLCNGGTGSILATAGGGTAPYTYAWVPAGGTNANATGITAGSYTVTVTDLDGCTATSSATITQPTALAVSLAGPLMICSNSTGTLTATATGGTMPYTYAWSSGLTSTTNTATVMPIVAQTYTVYVTDNHGCKDSATIPITLGPPIFVTVTSTAGSYICNGMSTTLCATATGGTGGNTFVWQPGGFTTPCVTVLPTSTTTYTITVSDTCGTSQTAAITININPAPVVGFNANIFQGCAPLCIQFYNTTTLGQGGPATYLWAFGNGDTVAALEPIYCYPTSGDYSVTLTVTSDSGCSATLKKVNLITVFTHPNAAFTISPQPATILNPTIQFTDVSTDPYGLIYWSWSFGDLTDSTSVIPNPSHTYLDTGSYCARLAVMDSHGCTDTATNCLVIDPIFNFYIPSAFSPNGDGKNPTFQPKGQYIKSFEMYIFDRWGMLLCHTTDLSHGWDGTIKGGSTIAQEDTYVYKILVTDSRNKQHSFVGNVTLLK